MLASQVIWYRHGALGRLFFVEPHVVGGISVENVKEKERSGDKTWRGTEIYAQRIFICAE